MASLVGFGQERKVYQTQRVSEVFKIDGKLDEAFWKELPNADQFTQTIPKMDKPSEFISEVKLGYNDHSILIGATLYQPASVHSKQITARDQLNNINADGFTVFFDTYDDHQNGFMFKVSSAGVQQDARMSNGDENGDLSWDAVWDAKVSSESDAWVVEMEIPFAALRFAKKDDLVWGINFLRTVRKINESSYWNRIDVQKQGFLAQTALLKGLHQVIPPTRLFLFPYLSTGMVQQEESGITKQRWLKSGGLDIKYGLNESFTLDMTLIPDFSQVISDNLVRNLSPFEQLLTENRPFFTEGTEMFSKADLFYTRRVGQTPSDYYTIKDSFGDTSNYEIKRNPNVTTLYNAFKLSGRNKNKLGLGIFNAIGAPMYAQVYDKQQEENFRIKTEPLSNYNVIVIDQALKGQSSLNFTNTNLIRQGKARDANVSSLILNLFNKKEDHVLMLVSKLSSIWEAKQNFGTALAVVYSKISGQFTYDLIVDRQSPFFDKSDMGIQFDFNQTRQMLNLNYAQFKPKSKKMQLYKLYSSHTISENSVPFAFRHYEGSLSYFILFKSFWDVTFSLESKPFAPNDYYQLRSFNQILKTYPYVYLSTNGSSDSRKKLFWAFYGGYGQSNERHTQYVNLNQTLRYRFSPRLDVIIKGEYTTDNNNIGYAYYDNMLNLPVVGRRDVREYSAELSVKYNLNPNMNFTGRFRHYNSFITYNGFHLTDTKGEWRNLPLKYRTGLNENYNLQNVDVFFNWMFRPGSRVVLSYKQWLNDAYLVDYASSSTFVKNVSQVIKSPHAYEFAIRFIYFLDYNQYKKHGKRYL